MRYPASAHEGICYDGCAVGPELHAAERKSCDPMTPVRLVTGARGASQLALARNEDGVAAGLDRCDECDRAVGVGDWRGIFDESRSASGRYRRMLQRAGNLRAAMRARTRDKDIPRLMLSSVDNVRAKQHAPAAQLIGDAELADGSAGNGIAHAQNRSCLAAGAAHI